MYNTYSYICGIVCIFLVCFSPIENSVKITIKMIFLLPERRNKLEEKLTLLYTVSGST